MLLIALLNSSAKGFALLQYLCARTLHTPLCLCVLGVHRVQAAMYQCRSVHSITY